jgi:hypothetical protein
VRSARRVPLLLPQAVEACSRGLRLLVRGVQPGRALAARRRHSGRPIPQVPEGDARDGIMAEGEAQKLRWCDELAQASCMW